jgi:hypothetical protein
VEARKKLNEIRYDEEKEEKRNKEMERKIMKAEVDKNIE